jgi:hypothetical protein
MPRKKTLNRSLRILPLDHAEMQAGMLVNALNAPDRPGSAEVLQILALCQQLDELRKEAPASYPKEATEAIWTFMHKRDSLLKAVNEIVGRFQFTAALVGGIAAWERYSVQWSAAIAPGNEARMNPETDLIVIPAISAIRLVLDMLADGTLHRVRHCTCGQWFFARTNKKQVCGDTCRSSKFRHSEYMRKNRKQPGAQLALKRAKAKKRKA